MAAISVSSLSKLFLYLAAGMMCEAKFFTPVNFVVNSRKNVAHHIFYTVIINVLIKFCVQSK